MSHRPERKEKNCLNCNNEVHGKFCHVCGQENVEPKETFWHLVTHFVYDITHFDGKFFETVKYLLFKPGFLPLEYMKGKRMSYLNPIRMYVFTSAFFFLFFFSFVVTDEAIKINNEKRTYSYKEAVKDIDEKRKDVQEALGNEELPGNVKQLLYNTLLSLNEDSARLRTDTIHLEKLNVYNSADVDSIQQTIPVDKRDGWLERKIRHKKIQLFEKYGNDSKTILNVLFKKFFHYFPQILFISLPIFALLLKLLYYRRKQYYYADHAIYTIHLYCAMFIMIFLEIILLRVEDYPHFNWVSYVRVFFLFYILWYIYKSMRIFYMQSRAKTILKYLLVMFISFFVMTFLAMAFFVFSVFTI